MRFCIVTSAHVCNNPRLVKEADALHAAGHDVRVVAVNVRADYAARDDEMMRGRAWRLHRVQAARRGPLRGRMRWLADALSQSIARSLVQSGARSAWLDDRALSRNLGALERAARREPADVYVAHNLPALPAAAAAARSRGALLGFDAEDLHTGELPDTPAFAAERALISRIESRYLARCARLTASSDGIADALAERYGVRRPFVVHNVFSVDPLAESVTPRPLAGAERTLSLYWYSQTIGAGRGLEDALAALALLRDVRPPVTLAIRGTVSPDYSQSLSTLIARLGVGDRVRFLDVAPPDAMVALAAEHDVGLALEQPDTLNRALCVTNKLFTYLAAGVAVAATDTPGQRAILDACPDAGFLYAPGDVGALAQGIRRFVEDRRVLARARAAARTAAETRFSWQQERPGLVAYLTGDLFRSADLTSSPGTALHAVSP